MTNPMVDDRYAKVVAADVRIGRHMLVRRDSLVLPDVTIGDGVAVGALSVVKEDCAEFGIYSQTHAKLIRERRSDLLTLEKVFLECGAS